MRTLLLSGLLLLAACGGRVSPSAQDAGEEQSLGCPGDLAFVLVTVLDAAGQPLKGATVMATHLESGYTQTGTTDAQGQATSVTQDIGVGTVRVRAIFGQRVSDTGQVAFLCEGCACRAEPQSITLRFRD